MKTHYLAKILGLSRVRKAIVVTTAVIVCLAFTFLLQSGYTLRVPVQASVFLSLVCIILPLIGSLFVYRTKWARIMLLSGLIAGFCALNIVIDMQVNTYVAERRCQTQYHGSLWVENGAMRCMWDDGVSEGQITSMGSSFTYSLLMIPPFLGTVVLGLGNALVLPVIFIHRNGYRLVGVAVSKYPK